jgi:hypothetical protein
VNGKERSEQEFGFWQYIYTLEYRILKKITDMNFSSVLSKISRSIWAQRSEREGGEEDFRRKWHNFRQGVIHAL